MIIESYEESRCKETEIMFYECRHGSESHPRFKLGLSSIFGQIGLNAASGFPLRHRQKVLLIVTYGAQLE